MSGKFQIHPKKEVSSMETYIGPPSIKAGGTDYTMLVVIPTDSLDNPFPENTLVLAKHQFLNSKKSEEIFTKDLISYKTIYSQKESGRLLVSSEALGTNSKEFSVAVFPAIPIDFKILATRPHYYADIKTLDLAIENLKKEVGEKPIVLQELGMSSYAGIWKPFGSSEKD